MTLPTDPRAAILVRFADMPSVAFTAEEKAALLEGARLIEREARAAATRDRDARR